jgi:hypothetical protein
LLKRHFKIDGKYYDGIRMGLLVDWNGIKLIK